MAPRQKPHRSRQDYATPRDFLVAVQQRLGIGAFSLDLAADDTNYAARCYITKEQDALKQVWKHTGWAWLNPPFGHIAPWAEKCATSTTKIALLVPASVGSNWFAEYVAGRALVLFLRPRLSFDGVAPYPKDCILCLYSLPPGYETWDWKYDLRS